MENIPKAGKKDHSDEINQSGIDKIYYTEPYPNSISKEIFLKDCSRKIEIKQFEGSRARVILDYSRPILIRRTFRS